MSLRTLVMCALVCLASLAMTACTGDVGKEKFAVVDGVRVIKDSTQGRNAIAHLQQAQEIFQHNLNIILKKLEAYPDKQQAHEIALASQNALQQHLQAHEAQINTVLGEALQNTIREYRDIAKVAFVAAKDTLMAYEPKADVTQDIITAFEKVTLSLPELPQVVENPQLPPPLAVNNEVKPAPPAPPAPPKNPQPAPEPPKDRPAAPKRNNQQPR